jgi:hypothetical protein
MWNQQLVNWFKQIKAMHQTKHKVDMEWGYNFKLHTSTYNNLLSIQIIYNRYHLDSSLTTYTFRLGSSCISNVLELKVGSNSTLQNRLVRWGSSLTYKNITSPCPDQFTSDVKFLNRMYILITQPNT